MNRTRRISTLVAATALTAALAVASPAEATAESACAGTNGIGTECIDVAGTPDGHDVRVSFTYVGAGASVTLAYTDPAGTSHRAPMQSVGRGQTVSHTWHWEQPAAAGCYSSGYLIFHAGGGIGGGSGGKVCL